MSANRPPTANAGDDHIVECTSPAGTSVKIDGSASSDPDGDSLTYVWTGAFGAAEGINPLITLPYGIQETTLTVSDGQATATDTVAITVQDTTAPAIETLAANPNVLWPPNHKMIPITLSASTTDICDPTPSCNIMSVDSTEPTNGLENGDITPDWEVTGKLSLNLRAERYGQGNGRVYTITIGCTDASGNILTQPVTVSVPHDQRKK